ncbi:MAG: GH36-type glycosyl hydrolase domain-containing protein [Fimbriimonas sp.]
MVLHTPNDGRLLANPYGQFDLEDASFVISDIRTPRPWANVLSNDRYGVVVSQAGGGFAWHDNCQIYRISRWDQDLVQDGMGRFVYVQDMDAPNDLWSTTYSPTRQTAAEDRCVHGLGFTRFERRFRDLEVRQTMFVPKDGDAEVWIVEVRNLSDRPRRLRLASYQELHLGSVGDWHREFHRLFMESRVVDGHLVAWKHPNLAEHRRDKIETPKRVALAWSGADSVRWITDKQAWLGRQGSVARPAGLYEDVRRGDTPRWDDPVAVGMLDLALQPGEIRTLVHAIGVGLGEAEAVAEVANWDADRASAALAETKASWRARCGQGRIPTSDPVEDLMVNAWFPYQAIAGRVYARCAYYQQGGAYGYRDQLQDSLMLLSLGEPETTLTQLGRHAEAMFSDGGVKHWWMPTEGWGPESWHSDTSLWLMFGLLAYLETTGDTSVLSRDYAYLSRSQDVPWVAAQGRTSPEPLEKGTLLEHAVRGVQRALDLRSPRGLPLIGAGDWNDGLSHAGLDGNGESVWLAMFLFDVVKRSAPVLRAAGESATADEFEREAEALRLAVETHAWDGEWYLGGTRDDGRPFGSRENEEGRIFLNPQTWAVLTGIASPERAAIAMDSVRKHLVTEYGALLLQPAFSKVDPYIGYITRYAPGLRENGGVYSHASTWAVLAFDKIGDRATAQAIFRGMLPPVRSSASADLYAAEPYVMPGNVDGPDSPFAGRAGWTWYTGSAAWMVRVAASLSEL